jgi:hypothetical protein
MERMKIDRFGRMPLFLFENLAKEPGIKHFITTRMATASPHCACELNLSFSAGKTPEEVLKNRKRLSNALDIPLEWVTTAQQVHGCSVRILSRSDRGSGAWEPTDALEATDALVTNLPDICPMVLVADCVPILLYDRGKKVVAAVHAGWRGTLDFIVHRTVRTIERHFGSRPADIIAGIGPSIGPCCFHVGPEVIALAQGAFGSKNNYVSRLSSQGGCFDLWAANHDQLLQAGLTPDQIETARICTAHDHKDFFSYRKEGTRAGRFGAGICLITD